MSECGCKSAEIGYSVYRLTNGHDICVIGGKVGLARSRQALFVLSLDRYDRDPRRKLTISCAAPE